jgi:hypothetical protein
MSSSIGFTGTQQGASGPQMYRLRNYLIVDEPQTLKAHHGMCIGADVQFHLSVRIALPDCKIEGHPPIRQNKAAMNLDVDVLHKPYDFLVRNHDIVDLSDRLYATPKEFEMIVRSGTWATVRYSLKIGVPVIVILPDGNIWEESTL